MLEEARLETEVLILHALEAISLNTFLVAIKSSILEVEVLWSSEQIGLDIKEAVGLFSCSHGKNTLAMYF